MLINTLEHIELNAMNVSLSMSLSLSVMVSTRTHVQVFYTQASAVRECQYVECYHL